MITSSKLLVEMQVIRDDVKYIRKEIEGNGHPGLISKVDKLTVWKNKAMGVAVVVSIIFVAYVSAVIAGVFD